MNNLLIFVIYSFVILLGIINYRLIFINFFFNKTKGIEISLVGISVLFVIFLIANFAYLFISHEYIHK